MWRDDPASVRPMLASIGDVALDSREFGYEPKYDGIRAIVAVEPARGGPTVRFWSRLGNEKTRQFPEVADAVRRWARRLRVPLLLDGEIVALDARGQPIGFQHLQGRLHVAAAAPRRGRTAATPTHAAAALVVFDLLREGRTDLRPQPLRERRTHLERLFMKLPPGDVRISEHTVGDGRALHIRAREQGWEGLLAKRLDAPYRSGRRSPEWRKIKLVRTQTCVVGGWTEPRGTRAGFGALILGVYDDAGNLQYVGHAGSGFSDAELTRVWTRLRALEVSTSPFAAPPPTNERPHWVRPQLVAEVKFTEWTSDGFLRHPTYLGLRDDVAPASVRREPDAPAARTIATRGAPRRQGSPVAGGSRPERSRNARAEAVSAGVVADVLGQLDAIEAGGGKGVLTLPGEQRLEVTNLGKVFWPKARDGRRTRAFTKGDLFRHYVRVAPVLLPVLADRPLVMKRHPNGVSEQAFYQHKVSPPLPPGVRVEEVLHEDGLKPQIVGGSLVTLLYTAQLAAISQDPWFSRLGSLDAADFVAIDLDPPDGLPFARVRDVALWVRDALDALGVRGFLKTSGSRGLHIYVPMAPGTSYEAGLLFGQIVATQVAHTHARAATVERAVKARGARVYVDYLQNIRGKTLASAYSARASQFGGVSTPLRWEELGDKVSPEDFTIGTFGARLRAVGDLWADTRSTPGADLRQLTSRPTSRPTSRSKR